MVWPIDVTAAETILSAVETTAALNDGEQSSFGPKSSGEVSFKATLRLSPRLMAGEIRPLGQRPKPWDPPGTQRQKAAEMSLQR